jgi:putative transposase
MLIVSQRQLEEVLGEYVRHYNQERPHRSRDLRPPAGASRPVGHGAVRSESRFGGLINEYYRELDAV